MAAHMRAMTDRCIALINVHLTVGLQRCLSSSPVQADVTSQKVRRKFVDYFTEQNGHREVPSSPVRPRGDPTLLFVNAGMNQFKPILLGTADPRSEMAGYRRVVNSQKCVRAGGKHNDLDEVGRDLHHHTFFEMLGNWSFGDYFKEEACLAAWRLLTEEYGIPPDRLYVSYFAGDAPSGLPADKETRDIWLSLGVPSCRLLPFGLKENFWEMGVTGPCGPCSEIHYDHAPRGHAPDLVEIWNLVFMQYSREPDHSLRPLPQWSVDTGMGLERLVTVLQGRRSNYDTDLFTPLLTSIHQCSGVPAYGGRTGEGEEGRRDMAYRVVADHIRTLSVCIADGVYPGMTGPELVLRRILRRAVRFSSEVLQFPPGALASLVPTVTHTLGDAYPELHRETDRIVDLINDSEAQFLSCLQQGRRVINRTLHRTEGDQLFPAPVAWSLHRDLGFPLDLVSLMLEESGRRLDQEGLDHIQEQLRSQVQVCEGGDPPGRSDPPLVPLTLHTLAELQTRGVPHTDDSPKYSYRLVPHGKYEFAPCEARVLALLCGQAEVEEVGQGQRCGVILDFTCFYATQGGQSHDHGYLTRHGLQDVLYPVVGVQQVGGYVVHQVITTEDLRMGDQVQLHLDQAQRLSCMVNHTATHVLNFCLRQQLGPSVEQRGSHVSPHHLRFDFSIKGLLSVSQLQEVERHVQEVIRANQEVYVQEVPLEQAKHIPGLRTIDEVYPDPVRVVSVGAPVDQLFSQTDTHTSAELCCGTHLCNTGGIRDLVVVSERQTVKGVSRIVAVTGDNAREAREAGHALAEEVESLGARLAAGPALSLSAAHRLAKEVGVLTDAVDGTPIPQWQRRELQARLKVQQRNTNTAIRKLETREATVKAQSVLDNNNNRTVLVEAVETDSLSVLMKTVNQVSSRSPGRLVLLLSLLPSGRVLCACQVPKGVVGVRACDWAAAVCSRLGGNAGGSVTVATGTGAADDITDALRWAEEYARQNTHNAP